MPIKIHYAIASGLYTGLMRPFPGTWGTGAVVVIWYLIGLAVPSSLSLAIDLSCIIAIILIGVYSTSRVLKAIESGVLPSPRRPKDPNLVVIDEWAGMWIMLLGTTRTDYVWIIICFFLFRALDIIKPPPIRSFEKIPGAWGIMLDDVVAGILGLVIVSLIRAL